MAQKQKLAPAIGLMSAILEKIPPEGDITRCEYEGPRIALYTKNPRFLLTNNYIISDIVNSVKKRVVVRTDKSIRKDEEEVRKIIDNTLPPEAEVSGVLFDDALGEVVIEAKKPRLLTQNLGFNHIDLTDKTGWKVKVRKASHIPSTSIQIIYQSLKTGDEDRERILRESGEKIFRPRLSSESEVTLKTLGSFGEVGRSCILLETTESKILLDCGIHPGARKATEAYPRIDWGGASLEEIDAVILSHAHLDHTGFLPTLFKYGYDGPIYCSEPTLPMMTLLLTDAVKIASMEGGRLIYDQKDVRETIRHCITLPYGLVTDVSPDIKLVLNNAGHILGSATTHLHIGEGAHNVVYTGDFKYGRSMLLESAVWNYPRVETLLIEGTYGSKQDIMPPREDVEMGFVKSINETLQAGGKVLIPVPAVGRAQEVMLVLDQYMREKKLVEAPIFIEGMISESTAIHISYPDYLARELRSKILDDDENPFHSDYFTVIEHPSNRSEALSDGPSIIMATSGMLEGGPVIDYLGHLAPSEKNKIVFVSYQVSGTLGRRVLDGSRQISLIGDNGKIKIVDIKSQVERVEGFSGHSDYNQIIKYVSKMRPKLQMVIVNHGEKRKVENLAYAISRLFRVPALHPSVQEAIRAH